MADRRALAKTEQVSGAVPVGAAMALAVLAGGTVARGQALEDVLRTLGSEVVDDQKEQAQPEAGLRDPLSGSKEIDPDAVKRDENDLFELHVQDEDLANVLRLLSIQSERNIIASKNVSATVTADLYGVTFYEALDAILNVNNYGYIERGNFIEVYTREELQQLQEAQRKTVSAVVHLNYLSAIDAAEFVKPLLSDVGEIKANGDVGEYSLGDAPVGSEKYASGAMLVVYDYEENVEAIRAMLAEIDTRPSQVLVEATILQTSLNEANEFGIDFTVLGSLNIGDFVALNPVDALRAGSGSRIVGSSPTTVPVPGDDYGTAVRSNVANFDGPATLKVGLIAGDFSVFLKALDQVADTTILSRPKILTLNRQPARVLVGRKVGYLSTTSTDTATTQTVEFLDTGTQLNIRPFVSREGMIRMELKPSVSEAVIRSATDATGAAVTIPDEITNELTANVMVRDGQTIVLGGLFREATSTGRRQVPWLGDLPIVGAAFRGHDNAVERSEIIFMITPTIVNDNMLIEFADRAKADVDRTRAGAREGLLPFSREKRASQLLVKARKQVMEGKREEALYTVQRALTLNPMQPDAIALREKLVSEPTVWPDRSMLQEIISGEAARVLDAAERGAQAPVPPPVIVTAAEVAGGDGCLPESHPEQADAEVASAETPAEGTPQVEQQPEDESTGAAVEAPVAQAEPAGEEPSVDPASEPVNAEEQAAQAQPAAPETAESGPRTPAFSVQVASMDSVDIEAVDAPIGEVLRALARGAGVNLVTNKDVAGNVTAEVHGVSFYEALDVLTASNGYAYLERGKFIEVYPADVVERLVQSMTGASGQQAAEAEGQAEGALAHAAAQPSGEQGQADQNAEANAQAQSGEPADPSPEIARTSEPVAGEGVGAPIDLTSMLLKRSTSGQGDGSARQTPAEAPASGNANEPAESQIAQAGEAPVSTPEEVSEAAAAGSEAEPATELAGGQTQGGEQGQAIPEPAVALSEERDEAPAGEAASAQTQGAGEAAQGMRVDFAQQLATGGDGGWALDALFDLVVAQAVWDSPLAAATLGTRWDLPDAGSADNSTDEPMSEGTDR